jgi:hypothetical protein
MGRPKPPKVIQPPPPTLYRSVIPEEDYARAAERLQRINADTQQALARRDAMVGTPTDVANRMAERNVLTAAAYQSALPTGEGTSQYDPIKAAAAQALELAKARREAVSQQPQMPSA